jgi:hypothetical protein
MLCADIIIKKINFALFYYWYVHKGYVLDLELTWTSGSYNHVLKLLLSPVELVNMTDTLLDRTLTHHLSPSSIYTIPHIAPYSLVHPLIHSSTIQLCRPHTANVPPKVSNKITSDTNETIWM